MSNTETRNTLFYLLGVLVLAGLLLFLVGRFGESGFGFLRSTSVATLTYDAPREGVLEEGVDYRARFTTNFGVFEYNLLESAAPETVNNFVFLSQEGYYDGVLFHRVVQDFIIQSGSRLSLDSNPNNDGLGGPGYRFADEMNWDAMNLTAAQREELEAAGWVPVPGLSSRRLGKYTLAMANAGPGTNGSQFFIVTAEDDSESIEALQGRHTVFGELVSGADIIDRINSVAVDLPGSSSPRPLEPLRIESIEIFSAT